MAQEEMRAHIRKGRRQAVLGGWKEPALLWGRRGGAPGWRQVRKWKRMINRLVREQSIPGACVRHSRRTRYLAFFLER